MLIAIIIFVTVVLWGGGERIRWLGEKSEEAGKVIKEKSEELGDKADTIKQEIEEKKEKVEKTVRKIKGIFGDREDSNKGR
ncbi:MAG: hypothetical protein AB1488_02845 [Nitrospirota bacterium]